MLQVNIEKIIPVTEARDMFNKIVDDVEGTDELYVLTKNGKPAAVVVGVNHLEKLTGDTHPDVVAKMDTTPFIDAAESEDPPTTEETNQPEESESVFASADEADAVRAENAEVETTGDLPSSEMSGELAEPFPSPAPNDLDHSELTTPDLAPTSPAESELTTQDIAPESDTDSAFDSPTSSSATDPDVPLSEYPEPAEPSDPFVEPNGADSDASQTAADDSAGPTLPPRQDY